MRKAKYTVKPTTQFKKDYKLAMKRGLDISLLEDVIATLAMGGSLPEKNKDHALVLTLARTGTHSDLFGKSPERRFSHSISRYAERISV